MLEFEVKARVPDPEALRRRLGAPRRMERHRDTYFRHPARDFAETDEALRLRSVGGTVELTYKGPKLDPGSKARIERTVSVGGYDEARAILEAVGFTPVADVVKRREHYRYADFDVALDEVDGLGAFVELERMLPEGADVTETREAALRVLDGWGLDETIRTSYLELLLASEDATGRPADG